MIAYNPVGTMWSDIVDRRMRHANQSRILVDVLVAVPTDEARIFALSVSTFQSGTG